MMRVIAETNTDGGTTLLLAGTLNGACVPDIEAALAAARRIAAPIALDFSRVRLIDRPMLRYLVDAIGDGVRAVNCPEHVARWIRRESHGGAGL
jgi:anti-anti-sigma regulatory factor